MAEGAVVKVLLETVKKLIMDEADLLLGVKKEIRRLQTELEWMYLSIKEADEALKSDEKLKLWVKQVRGIIYETEDVIDEFILEIVRNKQNQKDRNALTAGMKSSIRSTIQLKFVHNLGKRIKDINTRVADLKENKDKYWPESTQTTRGGVESSNQFSSLSLQQKIQRRRAAIAAEEHRDAILIHEDSERQVMSLLRGEEGRLRIISIVGMGGVGKTTLSRKAYNVMDNFDFRAFVYISKTYSPQELLKSIMKCFPSISSEAELSNEKLFAHLKGKKYLIVLDDVWDTEAWESVKSCFPDEQTGSRVLLTTRHESVANCASSSRNTNIHKLAGINEKESWGLFLNKVFPLDSDINTSDQQSVLSVSLEDLGKKMVEKCCGLPLAIVLLGSLLLNQGITDSVWRRVNKSASWHLSQGGSEHSYKCSGILALSYDYLPYYLKPCFLYMSFFPEDSKIRATKLFQCWIAEGFVQKRGEETLEDTAEGYLEELISRSLIQVDRLRCDGRVKTCGIHNLLRDISIAESNGDEFSQIYGSIDKFYQDQDKSRRVAVYCKGNESNELHLSKFLYTQIRSLMCRYVCVTRDNYFSSLFRGFKSLRVLEFYSTKGRVSLPKEVGELIHLRYLSLEKTKLEKVDTSYLSKLSNLQTLNLKGCISELELDDQIWSLRQLRNLYLDKIIIPTTNKSSHPWTATVKLDIGNLTNLQLLVIQAGDWIYSGGLKRLISLRKLKIEECSSSHSDEICNAIANFTNLQSLTLISQTSITPLTNEGVPLPSIHHTCLTRLHLIGNIHEHISFPPGLRKLKLEWSWIEKDPMLILGSLRSLTFLHLGFESYLGEKMVCSKEGFGRLQTLELVSILNLEEWIIEEGALASLTKLKICDCKRLKMIPDGLQQLTKLEELSERIPQLRSRMAEDVGEDWHKIMHIPSRVILL